MKKIFIILLFMSGVAHAAVDPVPLASDHRIREIPYDRNNVTVINCHYDVETTIEFAPDEMIVRATAGQPAAWAVLPSQTIRNILTIQPKLKNADTNLTVLTNKRVYLYELRAREQWNLKGKNITFFVRYIYPKELNRALEQNAANWMEKKEEEIRQKVAQDEVDAKDKIDPSKINLGYTFSGDNAIAPLSVFDDSQFTYFQFDKNSDLPAIYTVDDNRNESILNYRIEPPYMVVETIANRFTLRSGDLVTTVIREKDVIKRNREEKGKAVTTAKDTIQPEW